MIIKCTEKEKENIIKCILQSACTNEIIDRHIECNLGDNCRKCIENNIKFEIAEDKENV